RRVDALCASHRPELTARTASPTLRPPLRRTAGAALPAAPAAALDLVGLRGRVAQRGTDLVDIELDGGAVVALTVGEGALLQAALCDDAGALLQRLGHVLRGVAPDGAAQEQSLAVLPLVRLTVEHARGGRDGERRDRDAGLRETQLGISGEVADHRDDGVIRHGCSLAPGLQGWCGGR